MLKEEGRTALNLVDAYGQPFVPESTRVLSSASGDGYIVETGISEEFDGQMTLEGHFISIYLDGHPSKIDVKGPNGYRTIVQPPNSLFINPAQNLFEYKHGFLRWGAVEVSRERVRKALGLQRDLDFAPQHGLVDKALAHVVRGLIEESQLGHTGGNIFMDGLVTAIATKLAVHSGLDENILMPGRALSRQRLQRVVEKMEDQLGDQLTVGDLAKEAAMSPAHFAREFKRHLNEAPHAYLVRRRLERARDLLLRGRPISEIATDCGFWDSGHLTRQFKKRYNITPAEFVKLMKAETKNAS